MTLMSDQPYIESVQVHPFNMLIDGDHYMTLVSGQTNRANQKEFCTDREKNHLNAHDTN